MERLLLRGPLFYYSSTAHLLSNSWGREVDFVENRPTSIARRILKPHPDNSGTFSQQFLSFLTYL